MLWWLWSRMLDATVVFSYGKMGFEARSKDFEAGSLEVDLGGKVALVTGANSGIGYATAQALARRGARLWLLCRRLDAGEEARRSLIEETGHEDVHLAQVDLSRRASIEAFCQAHDFEKIDILIHNAGVLPDAYIETEDGLELTLATNVLGPMLLTAWLWPALVEAREARVLQVSSGGMYTQKLAVEKLWSPGQRGFDGVVQYAQSKRAQAVLNGLLAERCEAGGVHFSCMHPGWVDTPAVRSSLPRFWKLTRSILRSPAQGADTIVWLAISEAARRRNGAFWFDRQPRSLYPLPGTRESQAEREALWRRVSEWVGGAGPFSG